jgi:hypothetical protein
MSATNPATAVHEYECLRPADSLVAGVLISLREDERRIDFGLLEIVFETLLG